MQVWIQVPDMAGRSKSGNATNEDALSQPVACRADATVTPTLRTVEQLSLFIGGLQSNLLGALPRRRRHQTRAAGYLCACARV